MISKAKYLLQAFSARQCPQRRFRCGSRRQSTITPIEDVSIYLDMSTINQFLPIHFYKNSHSSESQVLDDIATMKETYSIDGIILAQPNYPRDYRNIRALSHVLPSDFSIFYQQSSIPTHLDSQLPSSTMPVRMLGTSFEHFERVNGNSSSASWIQVRVAEDNDDTDEINSRIKQLASTNEDLMLWYGGQVPSPQLYENLIASNTILPSRIVVSLSGASDTDLIGKHIEQGVRSFVVSEMHHSDIIRSAIADSDRNFN